MSTGITVVKTTIVETNEDLLFGFLDMNNAEKKITELKSNAGFTGTVLYPYVEAYDDRIPFAEELYDDFDLRYLNRFTKETP